MRVRTMQVLDGYDEEELKKTISTVSAGTHKDKDEIIKYCRGLLKSKDRSGAMVEKSEGDK